MAALIMCLIMAEDDDIAISLFSAALITFKTTYGGWQYSYTIKKCSCIFLKEVVPK